ncbi:MAG: iron ABC transporter permease, partial [Armatimonadetes bacterium]|nr:iron ABC transporter permease [Armatimonadota bacterium]
MRPSQRGLFPLLVAPVALVLFWLVVGPHLKLVRDSLSGAAGLTLEGYRIFFGGRPGVPGNAELEALGNSLLVALGSVLLAGLVGVPLAFIFQRYEFPGRRIFAGLAMVPVLLPPLVGVVAFYFLYAESGVVTELIERLFRLESPPWRFTGLGAVLVVHAYSMYVYYYAFVTAGLARLDPSQAEAAATLGAGPARRLFTVLLPLLTPALVGAALLVFMTSMASFTAPLMFNVRVLTIQILNSRTDEQWLLMNTEIVVLAAVCIGFLALLRAVENRGRYLGGSKGSAGRRLPVRSGWARWTLAGVGVVAVLVLLLPHAMLLLMSFADEASWTTQILPPRYTTAAWRYVFATPAGQIPFINSSAMALQATVADVGFALAAGYLFSRFRFRGRGWLEAAAMLPYAIPGTIIALALAEWFSVRQWYLGRTVLISTYAILPLAYFVRNLPLAVRAVQASLAQVDPTLEEAAATLGSSPAVALRRVVAPLVAPGALAGGVLAMVAALGEFV